jgi:hypothetical protein
MTVTLIPCIRTAGAKRPITKRPKLKTAQAQNDPSRNDTRTTRPKLKTAQGTKRPKLKTTHGTKRPTAQNNPRHKTTQGTKRHKVVNFTVVLSTHFQQAINIDFQVKFVYTKLLEYILG